MSNEEMNVVQNAQEEMDIAVHTTETSEPVAVEQPTAEPTVERPVVKAPRRKAVKGVVKKARELVAEGQSDEQVLEALENIYLHAGRDAKNAKDAAWMILYDVKTRQLKPKTPKA